MERVLFACSLHEYVNTLHAMHEYVTIWCCMENKLKFVHGGVDSSFYLTVALKMKKLTLLLRIIFKQRLRSKYIKYSIAFLLSFEL